MNKAKVYFQNVLFLIITLMAGGAQAEPDSLKLGFKDAERLFLQNNLTIIAQKYNVEASKALIKQAALWDNPSLNTEQNLYDNTHRFFNHSNGNGQVYFVLNQIFKTAGKRGKQVQLARDDAGLQEAAFNDLMRNLRYNLQLDFNEAASLGEKEKIYTSEISSLNILDDVIDKSFKSGNSSFKESVRIKALLFSLRTEMLENEKRIASIQAELSTLLGANGSARIIPVLETSSPQTLPPTDELVAKALTSRPDYVSAGLESVRAKDNLAYQKSLAVPDITVGVVYDRVNSYAPHYFGLQIGLPLPLFDRNQGSIRAAAYDIKNYEYSLKAAGTELRNDVQSAVAQYVISCKAFSMDSGDFYNKYDELFKAMLKSYQKRQISLMEFVDFFDSYKETELKIIDQRYNLRKAAADLNYTVGSVVVNP